MATRKSRQQSGLFAGFLTGSALCLAVSAAAGFLAPLRPQVAALPEPDVVSTEITTSTAGATGPEIPIITPRADTARVAVTAPESETPEADRDIVARTSTEAAASDPVQTNTPTISAPQTPQGSAAETARPVDPDVSAPQRPDLETSEMVPEQKIGTVDVGSANVQAPQPSSNEGSDVSAAQEADTRPAASQDAPAVALQAPQSGAPEPLQVDTQSSERPQVSAAGQTAESQRVVSAPRADPVIALAQPRATAPGLSAESVRAPDASSSATAPTVSRGENGTQIALRGTNDGPAQPAPRESTGRTSETPGQTQMVAPETSEEAAVSTPLSDAQSNRSSFAPALADAPRVDSDPERPNLQIATAPSGTEPRPAPQSDNSDAALATGSDPRTPALPEFDGRAFDAFAQRFIPPDNRPFLAIVLQHSGDESVDMYDLLNFGQPITFAVDARDSLSRWRENEFRKAGFEVVALVPENDQGLSETLSEVETAARARTYIEAVPGAVALMDAPGSNFYRDPRKVSRLAEELNLTGRGLVLHEKFGANRAVDAARSAGIPAASLVRIIDAQRDAASIRRALDRAALDASKTGAAIVFGRTFPETVAVVLPWLLSNSARSVTLAPLTSTMNRMVE